MTVIVRQPIAWQPAFAPTLADLCATMTLDHIVRRGVDTDQDPFVDEFVAVVKPHHALQSRAVQLAAREHVARLATGDMDRSRDPWARLYQDRAGQVCSAGTTTAERYLRESPKLDLHADGAYLGPSLTEAQYLAELAAVTADAAVLAADVAASLARDIELDAELESDFAGGIAAAFAANRAAYAAELES